jgi:hypothetical protein
VVKKGGHEARLGQPRDLILIGHLVDEGCLGDFSCIRPLWRHLCLCGARSEFLVSIFRLTLGVYHQVIHQKLPGRLLTTTKVLHVLGLELGSIPLQAAWDHDTADAATDPCVVVVARGPVTFLVEDEDISGVRKIRNDPPC